MPQFCKCHVFVACVRIRPSSCKTLLTQNNCNCVLLHLISALFIIILSIMVEFSQCYFDPANLNAEGACIYIRISVPYDLNRY